MAEKIRITFSISWNVLKEFDEIAKELGMTRTSLLLVAINQYIDQQRALKFAGQVKDIQKALLSGKIRIEEVGMDDSAGD